MSSAGFLALTILKAHKIREEYQAYSLKGNDDVVCIQDLAVVVQQYTGIKIDIRQLDWGAKRFFGRIDRFKGQAIIHVAAIGSRGEPGKLTNCWQRFVAAKEMGHLVIDSEDSFTTKAAQLITEICDSVGAEIESKAQLQSEYMAVIFAIETLFPYDRRQAHLDRIRKGEDTTLEVARHFLIPEKYVQTALNQQYDSACAHIYKFL